MPDSFNMVLRILEFVQSKGSGDKNLPRTSNTTAGNIYDKFKPEGMVPPPHN